MEGGEQCVMISGAQQMLELSVDSLDTRLLVETPGYYCYLSRDCHDWMFIIYCMQVLLLVPAHTLVKVVFQFYWMMLHAEELRQVSYPARTHLILLTVLTEKMLV